MARSLATGYVKTLKAAYSGPSIRVGTMVVPVLSRIRQWTRFPPDSFDLQIAGNYYGFGLGEKWMGLGFLEEAIVQELKSRLKQMQATYFAKQPCTAETMSGSVSVSGEVYVTANGMYDLTHIFLVYQKKARDLNL